jgi:hypothetical protein
MEIYEYIRTPVPTKASVLLLSLSVLFTKFPYNGGIGGIFLVSPRVPTTGLSHVQNGRDN